MRAPFLAALRQRLSPLVLRHRRTLILVASVLTWAPAFGMLNEYYFTLMAVQGPSMYPFLNADYHRSQSRTWVLVDRRRPGSAELHRGSVIAFR